MREKKETTTEITSQQNQLTTSETNESPNTTTLFSSCQVYLQQTLVIQRQQDEYDQYNISMA